MPNILIIDDEPLQRLLVREILNEDPSLICFESAGGAQAFRLAQQYHPQTIILGLRVPCLDSFQTYERLRVAPNGQRIPLIVTSTGPRTDPDLKVLLERGHLVLIKPFEAEELQTAVRRVLVRSGAASRVL